MFRMWGLGLIFTLCSASLFAQSATQELRQTVVAGPDTAKHSAFDKQYLVGDPTGERARLLDKGFKFDLLYVSDSLGNVRSNQASRFTSYSRIRGTVDLDLEKLAGVRGLTIHITGVWQSGANLGNYLGALASPSALSSQNAFRLDAWWVQKRVAANKVAFRVGQFAGQDSYGSSTMESLSSRSP